VKLIGAALDITGESLEASNMTWKAEAKLLKEHEMDLPDECMLRKG